MNKELQDLAWSLLPKGFKEEVKEDYNYAILNREYTKQQILENLFGEHNLTSDAEGEEMLTVPRSKVQQLYKEAMEIIHKNSKKESALFFQMAGMSSLLHSLFGSKCLPDNVDSLSQNPVENCDNESHISTDCDKPAGPSKEGSASIRAESVKESRIASEETHLRNLSWNCDRLHIAAMAMQGILCGSDFMERDCCKEAWRKLAEISLACADALIAELGPTDKQKGE